MLSVADYYIVIVSALLEAIGFTLAERMQLISFRSVFNHFYNSKN